MWSGRCIVAGSVMLAVLAGTPAVSASGDHVVVGAAAYASDGDARATLSVAAWVSMPAGAGGAAVWRTPSGPQVRISLECVFVLDRFEIGHALFASGTGDDGAEYYLAVHQEFILLELSAWVSTAPDADMPCGAPRVVRLGTGWVQFLL